MSNKISKKSNKYFDSKTKDKNNDSYIPAFSFGELRIENPNDWIEIEVHTYDEYIKALNKESKAKEKVDLQHVENIFINEIYYKSMKQLPLIERKILYITFVEKESLEVTCLLVRKSPREVIKLRDSAIKHFKANLDFYKISKIGGNCNG